MKKLQEQLADVIERLNEFRKYTGSLTDEQREEWDELREKGEQLKEDIRREEETRALENFAKGIPVEPDEMPELEPRTKPKIESKEEPYFRHLGEQLVAIADVTRANAKRTDGPKTVEFRNRLAEIERRATGVSANVDSEAGFMIQTDFAGMMWDSAVRESGILSRVDSYTCGVDSNAVEWMRPKETDISSDAIFDGIKMYRAAEAATVTATKGYLEKTRLELEKSMGLAYWSGEAAKHAAFLGQFYQRGFSMALMRQMENEVINGTGVGQCRGILKSGNAVQSKAIETGQTISDPYMYKNITGMWNILHTEDRANAVWLVHPDTEENLEHVTFPVGTGGVPVFLSAGGGIGPGAATLKQRPVVPTDHCSAVGTVGDIILANLNKYMLIRKGTMDMNTSIHVRFLYDEEVFRVIAYFNGIVKNPNALTIKNSSVARASFVTLATRN